MSLTAELMQELELFNLFDLSSTQGGLKIHRDADSNKISAAERLFDKGMITRSDGGYLTDRGIETAEHVQAIIKLLS